MKKSYQNLSHICSKTARVLCILTSEGMLPMPFAGQNHLFLRENKFFHLFPSLTEKKERKKKGKRKNNTEKHAKIVKEMK